MFENKKFSIIEYGTDITLKRVKIFEEIIEKNGGSIIPYKQSKKYKIIYIKKIMTTFSFFSNQ